MINTKNKKNLTPLKSIIYSSKSIQILLLLQKNLNIEYNFIDKNGCNILDNIIDSKLTNKIKEDLCKILINYVDVTKINELNPTPTIIRAINNNLVNVVKNILYNLAIKNKIIITSGHLDKFLSGKCENITINTKNKDQCNFYSLVIIYLKNIIYGNMVYQKNCSCVNILEQDHDKMKEQILTKNICDMNICPMNDNKKNKLKNIDINNDYDIEKRNRDKLKILNNDYLYDSKYNVKNIYTQRKNPHITKIDMSTQLHKCELGNINSCKNYNLKLTKSNDENRNFFIKKLNIKNVKNDTEDIFYHTNNDNFICKKNNNMNTRKKIINLLKIDIFFIIIIFIIKEIQRKMIKKKHIK